MNHRILHWKVSLCRAAEASKTQLKEFQTSEKKPVYVVKPKPKPKHSVNTPRQQQQFNCRKCGTKHLPRSCPAFGRLCLICKGKHHYAKMCSQKNSRVHIVTRSENAAISGQVESEELFIGTLTGPRNVEDSAWFSNILVGGTSVNLNWIQEPKPMYCHSVFTPNSRTNHRCWKQASFFHRMETSR